MNETINKAKEALEKDFKPISDMRASGLYRIGSCKKSYLKNVVLK